MLAIAIIFGLAVPIINVIANIFLGNTTDEVVEAKREFRLEHPISTIIGAVVSCIPAIVYWIFVITQLVM